MIPIKLRLEGFLSYRHPVELDFTGFDLACISGENGAGKSALLDAITWALFGQARKRDESLINNHPAVESAIVTLDFDYENNRYRVQRCNPRGKTSSVEFFVLSQLEGEESRWKPLTERTLRETDQKIQDTLNMDFDTFTNASFFLQGKADQFATARPGERKRILSNILGLEIWETYREEASLWRRQKEKEVKELDGRLTEIQSELDEEQERKEHLTVLQERLAELTEQRQARARDLENVQRLRASLDEQHKMVSTLALQLEAATRTRDHSLSTLEARQEEKGNYDQVLAKSDGIKEAYQHWQKTRKALEAMEEVAAAYRKHEALLQEPLRIIQAEEARLMQEKKGLEEEKLDLEKALSDKEALQAKLQAAHEKIQAAEKQLARRDALEADIQLLQGNFAEAKAENPRLKDEMNDLKERIDQLHDTEGGECPLCGQALSADERQKLIETLTEEGKTLGDRFRENRQLLEDFEGKLQKMGAELADLKGVETELRELNRQADQFEHQLKLLEKQNQTWKETGEARLAAITKTLVEKTYAPDARQQLEVVKTDSEALGYDLEAHESLRKAEQAGRDAEENLRTLEQARAALAPIEREIETLKTHLEEQEKTVTDLTAAHDDAAARLAAAEAEVPDLAAAESDLHNIQEHENLLRMEVGGAQQKVTVLKTMKERKAALVEEREQLTQRIADLKQLERAFGKDGVPALLIEQALPEIAENTNNLLSRLTNGRMSFNFVTQREFKDANREDMKETLDMVISDSAGVRDYEMFSGGEAFRINFSIRLALSQVLAHRAGARLQTLVIDEGFGSQDAQGRQRLVEAINLVRDDFEKILVITHLEELKEAFPTRIEVEKTPEGSQIQVR